MESKTKPFGRAGSDSNDIGFIEANYEYSSNLPQILAHARCSLLVSTYQSRKVFVVRFGESFIQAGEASASVDSKCQPLLMQLTA